MSLITRNKISAEFSMASMSDMVFLLLIFFMITSTMVAPNALKLLLPSSNSKTAEKPLVTVSIKDNLNGTYSFAVADKKCNFDDIALLLKKEVAGQSDPCVSLHCDKSVPMEEVVKIMNIAKDNSWKLILATKPLPKQ